MKRFLNRWTVLFGILLTALLSACTVQSNGGAYPVVPLLKTGLEHRPGTIVQIEEIVIAALLLAAVVNLVTHRLRIPYTIGLVVVGFALTFIERLPSVFITPEFILALLVPPLVYEAAYMLNFTDLRRELRLVLALAVPGVILTTLLVGGMVSFLADISLPFALVFGALIAATDPVSVVALFRSLGAPKRLQVLMEGESLLNDGTAIVLFNLMLGIALTGRFNLGGDVVDFFLISGGGIIVGVASGVLISEMIGHINNALVETTLTTVLAYGSYLLAEYVFGVSGVLAVVAAGLASGQISSRGMSPTTRIVVFNFWEYAAFLANSFIFLIIGLKTDINIIIENLSAIFAAIVAVLVARAVTIYVFTLVRKDISLAWKNILFWGGLRGAISLALALSLPIDFPSRDQLQAMAFGVVLFTLLVQGLTMHPLVKRSRVIQYSTSHQEYDRRHARAIATRAAQARIQHMHHEGVISEYTLRRLNLILDERLDKLTEAVRTALEENPFLYQEELADAWLETLRAQRNALTGLFRNNIISEDIYNELVAEVDFQLIDPESGWEELTEKIEQVERESTEA